MGSAPNRVDERGASSFLWLAPFAPPRGWTSVPAGGMCLCAFLFVLRKGKVLLGRYADHPAWERLCGMERTRVRANAQGWTIPASHLKFGEDPREAAQRIGGEILTLTGKPVYSEPAVATFFYEPAVAPGEKHYDVSFLFEASLATDVEVPAPPWYEAFEWFPIDALTHLSFARQHEDVAQAWLKRRADGPNRQQNHLTG
jgi:ADP-ribose pyrophosphatase YjhB (NUDIX family)